MQNKSTKPDIFSLLLNMRTILTVVIKLLAFVLTIGCALMHDKVEHQNCKHTMQQEVFFPGRFLLYTLPPLKIYPDLSYSTPRGSENIVSKGVNLKYLS